jgi:hypothetical protein
VKLHGTNAAIGINLATGEHWCQSRTRILTEYDDNAGFHAFVREKDYEVKDLLNSATAYLVSSGCYDLDSYDAVVIYGEWCGAGIQKGVAINQLPKMFVVFGIKLICFDEDATCVWLTDDMIQDIIGHDDEARIFNIFTFDTYSATIDFRNPELVQNELVAITESVEAQCPVGKYFGVEGTGEGVVWKSVAEPYTGGDFMFKVKGQKHSESRVKRLASMDLEKFNSILEFVDSVVTENRLQHGLDFLREQNLDVDLKATGAFLKWVVNDCLKEETDTMEASGLSKKEVCAAMSKKARTWYFEKIN